MSDTLIRSRLLVRSAATYIRSNERSQRVAPRCRRQDCIQTERDQEVTLVHPNDKRGYISESMHPHSLGTTGSGHANLVALLPDTGKTGGPAEATRREPGTIRFW
jgi:hypothetical protein